MSKFTNLLGKVTGVELSTTDGDQEESLSESSVEETKDSPKPGSHPTSLLQSSRAVQQVPHAPVPLPSAPTRPVGSVNPDVVESKAQERFEKELPEVLGATTPKYQAFLSAKDELSSLLSDSLSGAALEEAVVKAALKKVKLTQTDVHQAVNAMREKGKGFQQEFAADLAKARAEKVDGPSKQIEETLKQVDGIEKQIASFQEQIVSLKAGIQPTKEGIAAAEQKQAQAKVVDDAAGAKMEEYLNQLEQNLLAKLPK